MPEKIQACDFLKLAMELPVIDVRSPGEFAQGHIPGAMNIPLFENEERVQVGTLYVQQGKEPAMQKGWQLVEPKLLGFISEVIPLAPRKEFLIHCWRGGLRSESLAGYYERAGFKVRVLEGGYKAYRHFIRAEFSKEIRIILIGGTTGSGKTEILKELGKLGEQVIDLEALANHKGSVFGHLGEQDQPTTEQFENNLYAIWEKLDINRRVWIEHESKQIGHVYLPDSFYHSILGGNMIEIVRPAEQRINRLVHDYSSYGNDFLSASLERIKTHMGNLNYKIAIEFLKRNDYRSFASTALDYYDKTYANALIKRPVRKILTIDLPDPDSSVCAKEVLKKIEEIEQYG